MSIRSTRNPHDGAARKGSVGTWRWWRWRATGPEAEGVRGGRGD